MSNDDSGEYVAFNPQKLKRFKEAYREAVGDGVRMFTFDGHEFLVSYAKYLIEFLEGKLK